GIGAAAARRLARAGAVVLLVARRVEELAALRDEIERAGGRAYVHPCDLADPEAVEALATRVLEDHGHVDVVVSNAGKSIHRWISQSYDRFHDFERTTQVNYLGPARLIVALLPSMRARGQGHLVSVGTAGAYFGAPGWTAYVASKTAFDTWLRGVAPEAAVDGVTTTTLYLTLVRTPMVGSSAGLTRAPSMHVDEAAGMVCRAIVERPRTIAPWWWSPVRALALLLDRPVQRITTAYARRTRPR
ncbi:MAG TPA: SDR family NAD(P)-dependent oxidoreductase, partial [Acidimicrobiales bacterium]|nr:SDR family NAD(P)-dependent oxidoreductase [Acidimicrobiales bacterium]